jgi:hypothetical protein
MPFRNIIIASDQENEKQDTFCSIKALLLAIASHFLCRTTYVAQHQFKEDLGADPHYR